MPGRTAVLIAVVGATLAWPGAAGAVDHVTLFVAPTKVSQDWKLSAAVVGATSPGARETFGITLTRTLGAGRGEEVHALRATPAGTISFDGRHGRWRTRLGTVLALDMTVAATGRAQDVSESQGCRGALARVPVSLRGTFALRTGTAFFGTIRRIHLTGSMTFNRGGPVDCTPAATETCSPSTVLTAVRQGTAGPAATLLISPDAGGWTTLSFTDRGGSLPAGTAWYHVMRLERLGFDPLSGGPPSLDVRLHAALAIRGAGTFTASETSTTRRGACRNVGTEGTLAGSFRTRFAGWGARIAVFGAAGAARHVHESA